MPPTFITPLPFLRVLTSLAATTFVTGLPALPTGVTTALYLFAVDILLNSRTKTPFFTGLAVTFLFLGEFAHRAYIDISLPINVCSPKSTVPESAFVAQPRNLSPSRVGASAGAFPPPSWKFLPFSTSSWFTHASLSPPFLSKVTPAYLSFL